MTNRAGAQLFTYSSLTTPSDSRSVAMGESFVAVPGSPAALMYNPACLAHLEGASLSYSHRRFYYPDDSKYLSFSGSVQTPVAVIGFLYNEFQNGPIFGQTIGEQVRIDADDHTVALGAAHSFDNGVSVGIALKTFDYYIAIPFNYYVDPGSDFEARAFLFDFGCLYIPGSLLSQDGISDEFNVGFSFQNFGTQIDLFGTSIQPPRYLRTGISYSIAILPKRTGDLTPFRALVTAEYRNRLNPYQGNEDDRDFWGFGLEVTAIDIFSVQLGGYVSPTGFLYGDRGEPALRYGFGLNIPFALPLSIKLHYVAIPTPSDYIETMEGFSVEVRYASEIF